MSLDIYKKRNELYQRRSLLARQQSSHLLGWSTISFPTLMKTVIAGFAIYLVFLPLFLVQHLPGEDHPLASSNVMVQGNRGASAAANNLRPPLATPNVKVKHETNEEAIGDVVLTRRTLQDALASDASNNKPASELQLDNHQKKLDNPQQKTIATNMVVSPLKPLDYQKYTVRVNTWKRQEQLKIVLTHLQTCDSVAQIQIVWCIAQGPVPDWLRQWQGSPQHEVVVEEHEDNSLNARFDLLHEPRTSGILTQDDDILRPCAAMDAGFALWLLDPHRMVGFDARSHSIQLENSGRWAYSYLSETEQTNRYSLTLTRFAFAHRDYFDSYTHQMPAEIRQRVAQHLNCEDIAFSFWVSAHTEGMAPLLADRWAMEARNKFENTGHAISGSSGHKEFRDACVNDFAEILDLKHKLHTTKWRRGKYQQSMLQCGMRGTDPSQSSLANTNPHVRALLERRQHFDSLGSREVAQEIFKMKMSAPHQS